MKEKVVRSADLTAYSSLFRKTYWGGGGPSAEASSPEIIASRNRLVEEYGLQSWFFTPKLMDLNEPGSEYDHPEAYRLSDGRALLLISNYSGLPPSNLGMVPTERLYHVRARSFLRVFDNAGQLRKTLKTLIKYEGNPPDEAAELRAVEAMLADPESEGVRRVLAECRHNGRSYWFLCNPYSGPRVWLPDNAKQIEFFLHHELGYGKAAARMIREVLPALSARVEDPKWREIAERHEQAQKLKRGRSA